MNNTPGAPKACRCVRVEDAVRYSLEERPLPACPEHPEPEPTEATPRIALNDDAGLAAAIGRALGTTPTLNGDTSSWN